MSTEQARPLRYCLSCGAENARSAEFCRRCGRRLAAGPADQTRGAAFVLNELETWRDEREIAGDQYLRLRDRYLPFLRPRAAPVARPAAQPAVVTRHAAAPRAKPAIAREGPGWLAEQQANLLLYLGAFLIVIAALVYVGYSGQASTALDDKIKMALLSLYTLVFLFAGLACLRTVRVQQAGVVFFAVGALMLPLNFVGAYGFFFADEGVDPTGLWLAGSIASALFYAAISYAGLGSWYSVPMVGAAFSSLTAGLVLSNAPAEAYPGSYIALSLLLSSAQLLPAGRSRDMFGPIGALSGHVVVPIALLVALAMTTGDTSDSDEPFFVLATRWYSPPTVAIAALFYWLQSAAARRTHKQFEAALTVVALAVSGGAAVTFVYALDVGYQWYGPAVALVGLAYGALGVAATGSTWAGQRHLGWMSLSAITVSWLFFEGVYTDFPRHGAGVHLGAAAFYLAAARLTNLRLPLVFSLDANEGRATERISASIGLAYAAALTLGIGIYEVLSAAQHVGAAQVEDTTWTFFGVSLGVALVAATMRSWWRELMPHAYGIAFAMSLFVLLASAGAEGQVAILLSVYAVVALVLTVWERDPLGLGLPAAFGFFALLAGWRYYEPNDAYLPIVLSGTAGALLLLSAALPLAARRLGRAAPGRLWATMLQLIAFGYAIAAPVAGGVRLSMLVDGSGFVGTEHFDVTLLFRLTAVSVALVAVAAATTRWWCQSLRLPMYGTALLMAVAITIAAAGAEGQVTLLLALYGALAFAQTIWEREPAGLAAPAGFGLFALFAAWRYYEPNDVYLPLAVSAIGLGLFVLARLFEPVAKRFGLKAANRGWPDVTEALAFVYAIAAPITGWVRLTMLADDSGFIGAAHFESTGLYQTSAASVGLLALLVFARSLLWKRLDVAALGSALVMAAGLLEIGHFRPENAQAYTAPLGVYILAIALLSLRVRYLPAGVRAFVPAAEILGAALIMGPSFAQSLDADAWRYGLVLLAEGIGFVGLALVQRRIWLVGAATTFVVMDGAHYLFFAGGPALPNWAILAIAGTAVMAAGTAILLGRENWTAWQKRLQAWWYRETTECPAVTAPRG